MASISTSPISTSVRPCLSITPTSSTTLLPKRKKIAQLRAQKWALTFPQCSLLPQQAVENLLAMFPPLEWYVISQELHQDGNPHLHLALSFRETFSSRDMHVFDKICNQHGNYQAMKNVRAWVAYVTKKGEFIAHGIDPVALAQHKSSKFNEIAKLVQEGKTIQEINHMEPGFVLHHKRKIEEYVSWIGRRKEKENKKKWISFSTADIQDLNTQSEMSIAAWLNLNIREPREFRQLQLYVYGPARTGKSSLVQKLEEYLNVYHIPRDEEFYDDYEDGIYDLAVLDEFTNSKTMQWMNQWLDGQVHYLRKKGGQILKRQNIPTIVFSNYTLEQNYHKLADAGKLEPLLTRFKIVEVTEFISIFQ